MADSPGSTLSSIASDEFPEDIRIEDAPPYSPPHRNSRMPPSKRRRTGASTYDRDHQTPISSAHEADHDDAPPSPSSSISSDTSGEVPNSPAIGYAIPDDDAGQGLEQVTVCRWDGCNAGDLGNMDVLVKHIKDVHIGSRQKKYACEWDDCTRKGMPHASGYALRAHMRSHTREKPFYCALPECDRSFTRSDALAKHMRTVHETEALRPSDPVPKHHPASLVAPVQPSSTTTSTAAPPTNLNAKQPRLRLVFSSKSSTTDPEHELNSDDNVAEDDAMMDADDEEAYPPDCDFAAQELALSTKQLFRLLRRQIHWAEEETEEVERDIGTLEEDKRRVGRANQVAVDDLGRAAPRGLDLRKWVGELDEEVILERR